MTSRSSPTPLADSLEPTIQHLEAQLPATRAALEAERRWARRAGPVGCAAEELLPFAGVQRGDGGAR